MQVQNRIESNFASTALVAQAECSDNQALHELMEILKEPFISGCDRCEGSGISQDTSCLTCRGKGFMKIDFV